MAQDELFPELEKVNRVAEPVVKYERTKPVGYELPNLGKAIRLKVPDFSDANRPAVCLEVDFPIAPVNALSNLEGNAGKPVYQMSKWWARRRSSVFRSLLIAAATEAPSEPTQAAKRVWDHYYANHQKAGHFKKLRVLDPFMGGGTTLVEGARLGFQMTGVDLNPVAWFVTKNELACSDPQQVRAFFADIEAKVKPLVQPFYTTTCPRGHKEKWVDVETGEAVEVEPLALPPDQRCRYRWEGPEVIYTFWAKHGPCQGTQAQRCGHRTPIFKSPVIAEKRLTTSAIATTCLSCGHSFNIELGETRMAPGAERVVLENEPSFTEATQTFAQLLNDYGKGTAEEKRERVARLLALVEQEPGLRCPACAAFAGHRLKAILERHNRASRIGDLKKKDFGIESRHVYMSLLVHPTWLQGSPGSENGTELGGWAGAHPQLTTDWWRARLANLALIEVRGRIRLADEDTAPAETEESEGDSEESAAEEKTEDETDRKKYGLPHEIVLKDGTRVQTRVGTIPEKAHFRCEACGRKQNILEAVKPTGHTAPVAVYALQCHCPQCEMEGYNYGGRYFKAPDAYDLDRLARAECEWTQRSVADLMGYWPTEPIAYAYMTHIRQPLPGHGYTHWWKLFNSRQLLVHAQLLRAITAAPDDQWSLDVREQALGAFQQYLRNQNMFCFWDLSYDKLVPMLSNANYHPKPLVVENCVFPGLGRGNWQSNISTVLEGLIWSKEPWEAALALSSENIKSVRVQVQDPTPPSSFALVCGSSADLSPLGDDPFDLVITDPPFGNNLFYADLADFFYVWLRIPLLKWYEGLPERSYFESPRTPHAVEAVQNPLEHPDDREEWERNFFIRREHLATIRQITDNDVLQEKEPNPLYRLEPASDFYRETLTVCWAAANRLLKPGGLMAFTFHHSEDAPWVDVLEALFNAGYVLVVTYPIRSDETKGEGGAFGSKKIEYDIIHVCRKRLEEPQPVSWAKMRRWVKDEAQHLKELLEHSHGKSLPESDLRVILRGKALEFYSRHYGQVYTGDGVTLSVKDALLGINQLLDDLLQGEGQTARQRPPELAEPASRLVLQLFQGRIAMSRDELHKTLRGTGVGPDDLEAHGWLRTVGTTVHAVPVVERFQYFTAPGRNRKILKTDLDQAHFLIGAAMPGSGIDVTAELDRETFHLRKSVDALLDWYVRMDLNPDVQRAAGLAANLISHWRTRPKLLVQEAQMGLFERLEAEEA